jgi:hypothetical protein
MPNLEKILNKPKAMSRKTWRETLRNRVGPGGERLWEILLELAEGRAWRPQYRDEHGNTVTGDPIAPTAGDRIAATRELAHMLYGKPVAQTEVANAEADARDVEAARSLTDAELAARVKRALAVDPGPEEPAQLSEGASSQTRENSID